MNYEDYIGKLGWFSDTEKSTKFLGFLVHIFPEKASQRIFCNASSLNPNASYDKWKCFTPLTLEEAKKYIKE